MVAFSLSKPVLLFRIFVAFCKRPLKGLKYIAVFGTHTYNQTKAPLWPPFIIVGFLGMHINKIGNYLSRASQKMQFSFCKTKKTAFAEK